MKAVREKGSIYNDVLEEIALMLDKDVGAIKETSKDELARKRKLLIDSLELKVNKSNIFEVKILEMLSAVDIIIILPKLIINYLDKSIIREENKEVILNNLKNISFTLEGKLASLVINIFIMEEISKVEEIPKTYKNVFNEFLQEPKSLLNNIILGKSLEEDIDLCINDFERITHISNEFSNTLINNLNYYSTNLIVLLIYEMVDD